MATCVCGPGVCLASGRLQHPLANSELCGLPPCQPTQGCCDGVVLPPPPDLALLCPQTAVRRDPEEVVTLFLLPSSFLWIQLMTLKQEGLT